METVNKLVITKETRPRHLEEFCGEALIQFTGATKVKTTEGDILIEMGDVITKYEDGTFKVFRTYYC